MIYFLFPKIRQYLSLNDDLIQKAGMTKINEKNLEENLLTQRLFISPFKKLFSHF